MSKTVGGTPATRLLLWSRGEKTAAGTGMQRGNGEEEMDERLHLRG